MKKVFKFLTCFVLLFSFCYATDFLYGKLGGRPTGSLDTNVNLDGTDYTSGVEGFTVCIYRNGGNAKCGKDADWWCSNNDWRGCDKNSHWFANANETVTGSLSVPSGYYAVNRGVSSFIMDSENHVGYYMNFYAESSSVYNQNVYITLNGNGGSDNGLYCKNHTSCNLNNYSSSRTGYSFAGWYTSANGGSRVTSTPTIDVIGGVGAQTYYAHWTINSYYFDVNPDSGIASFDIQVGSGTKLTNQTDYYQQNPYGTQFTITNVKAKTGYTYVGYALSGSSTSLSGSSNSNIKTQLGASWGAVALNSLINTYTITYNLNEGTNSSVNPSTYTVNTDTITLVNPTRTDYTFEGWYSDSNFTTKVVTIPKGSTGNKTLYAKWSAYYNVYQVDALYNGNSIIQNSDIITEQNNYIVKTIKFCKKATDTNIYTIGIGKNFKSLGTQNGTNGCTIIK